LKCTYFTYNTAHMEDNVSNMTREPIRVPAGEFQRHIGRYQDMVLTQPVAVTRNGRELRVMISADEYYRLKRRDRQVLASPTSLRRISPPLRRRARRSRPRTSTRS
jgi:PHD/YefM family antitoxin component YafN of YafNO toxin-antitoxin module